MNKQNQFVGNFNPYSKPLFKASIQADNSILSTTMTDLVKNQIQESNKNIETMFEQFLGELKRMEQLKIDNKLFTLIDNGQDINLMLNKTSGCRVVFVKIFEEAYRSFKGFCTWISITTIEGTYVIDLLKVRDSIPSLATSIFQNPKVLKIGLCVKQQFESLQRDFNIFSRTLFDLKQLLSIQNHSLDFNALVNEILPEHDLPNIKEGGFYKKPNPQSELNYISLSSSLLPNITFFLQSKIREDKTLLEVCIMTSKQALMPYECKFGKISAQFEDIIKQQNPKNARIFKKLLKWRIHTGRIRDESCEYILPASLLRSIVSQEVKSMGQLLSLYESIPQKQICRDYDQSILDIVNSRSEKIDLTKIQSEVNQCKSLNEFVKLVGWSDCNWKNQNSESIRLFKEIISMDPIDSCIIEKELSETKNRVLCNDDILDLFGYIPYFTKNDTKGLANQHSKFIESYNNRKSNNQNDKQKQIQPKRASSPPKIPKVPESIEQIYELANEKKKEMKKQKKRGAPVEEKEQPFTIDTQKFLKSIGWA